MERSLLDGLKKTASLGRLSNWLAVSRAGMPTSLVFRMPEVHRLALIQHTCQFITAVKKLLVV